MVLSSGGIEPNFANYYERTTKSLYGKDMTYKVYPQIVQDYMFRCGISDVKELPEYFTVASDLDYHDRIDMQAVWQRHIDASISSTVNLPHDTTVEEIEDLYMYAWKSGLKGVTVFRDDCERVGILTTGEHHQGDPEFTETELKRGMIMEVPSDLTYRKYKLHTGCGTLYLFVGVDDDGTIYDLFTNTDGVGGCTINTQANSRLISAALRGGVPIEYIIAQLEKAGSCPSYQYARGAGKKVSKGRSCAGAIANVLKAILAESETNEEDDTAVEAVEAPAKAEPAKQKKIPVLVNTADIEVCPECGAKLTHTGGCVSCLVCGKWSKCSG